MVDFKGKLTRDGQSAGHYTCDVYVKEFDEWFRTNDNSLPIMIPTDDVSKHGYVVLFEKT